MVIGFDARRRSDEFAHISAAVLAGAGFAVQVLPRALPTPVLSFAVRHLGCAAGVMVTASHNPPDDNGYKVYLGDGAQLVPPADRQIEAAIAAVGPAREVPLGDEWLTLGDDVAADYVAAVVAALEPGAGARPRGDAAWSPTPRCTAWAPTTTRAVFAAAGLAAPVQRARAGRARPGVPDRRLPEPGGARRDRPAEGAGRRACGADVAIAEDPDADRCSVVCGGRQLTGDEVGALLADWLLRRGVRGTYASSLVSGSLMHVIAAARGAAVGGDPDRLQVDHPGRVGRGAAGLRLRGGAGLRGDARRGAGQGRHLRRAGRGAAGRRAEGRRAGRCSTGSTSWRPSTGCSSTGQLSVRVEDLSLISDAMARLRAAPPTPLLGRAGGLRRPRAARTRRSTRCGCSATASG